MSGSNCPAPRSLVVGIAPLTERSGARWPAPPVDPRIAPRRRLNSLLDDAIGASRLTVVSAVAGAGKTASASSWVATAHVECAAWLSVRSPARLAELPALLSSARLASPRVAEDGADRDHAARVVVLDDFPAAPAELLEDVLQSLLDSTPAQVRFVLLCRRAPAIDLLRLGLAGRDIPLGSDDLAMTPEEIADALARHAIEPDQATVRGVADRTAGWACGVRLAALHLSKADTPAAGLAETDRSVAALLQASVVRHLDPDAVDLLVTTAVVRETPPGLAAAVLGPGPAERLRSIDDASGFVTVGADGSLRCHPVLRRLLLGRLRLNPARTRQVARRAAQWYAGEGDPSGAAETAFEARDWEWAGRYLVQSLAVPQIVATGRHRLLARTQIADAVGATEPLLLAAVALGRSWPELADTAIEKAGRDLRAGSSTPADELSLAVLEMGAARSLADTARGLDRARRILDLVPELTVSQRAAAPELVPLVQSHLGLFELWNGAPERARTAFECGARPFRPRPASAITPATQIAAADCLGQLAFLEAVAGELNRATRHASEVLTARPADGDERGVVHAQLATVWAHLARGELAQAAQRFETAVLRNGLAGEGGVRPGLAASIGLTAARLAAVAGDGRLGRDVTALFRSAAGAGWFSAQLRLAQAEAELNSGQPSRALHVLADLGHASAEAHALRARAWLGLGDLASAAASLRVRPVEPLSLITQIQVELIEARLAQATGDPEHQRALVDRSLRTAEREQLRTPVAWAKGWLHPVISADHLLLRRHGAFLASVRRLDVELGSDEVTSCPDGAPPATPLTRRELEILQRLSTMGTNEEIATELYLSTNTIKTHLKALYRKLEVTRRSDAVRRGRALGLC